MPRTVSIGCQDFETIRREGYFYIDKTCFIKEWWEEGDSATLITRPRRFGKTLTMSMIDRWFAEYTPDYNAFVKALLLGDKKAMNIYMNRTALAIFSCFDSGNRPSEASEPERFYHGFVLGLMVDLADRYSITSNRESGFGRYDVMLEPRNRVDDAFILEFKVHDLEEEYSLEDTVDAALKQIEEKRYAYYVGRKRDSHRQNSEIWLCF